MSQENVARFLEIHEAWNRGDLETAEALARDVVAPEVEIDPLYLGQVYKGLEGMREMRADISETWEDYRFELEETVDLDEHLLVVGRILGRGAGSGVPINQPLATLWTFRGDKAVRVKSFMSRQEALEAAGRSE
jgi:ketosteroid isomerase-like protein